MKTSTTNILFFIFLVLTSTVIADSYSKTGGIDQNFMTGNMKFVDGVETDINVVVLSDGHDVPVIDDLDGDGINEIIVYDDVYIKIFQNKTLDFLTSFAINFSGGNDYISNLWVQDINGDGYKEILFGETGVTNGASELPHMIYYNGSEFRYKVICSDINGDRVTTTHNNPNIVTGCNSDGVCLMASPYNTSYEDILVYAYNYSECGTAYESDVSIRSNTHRSSCFPAVNNFVFEDIDGDGTEEGIISFMTYSFGNLDPEYEEYVEIRGYDFNELLMVTETVTGNKKLSAIYDFADWTVDGYSFWFEPCEETLNRYISPPIVLDFSSDFGKEILVGANYEDDSFRIYHWSYDGTYKDQYPEIANGEGRIISNLVQAKAFTDSTFDDVCILGSDDVTGNSLDFLCASKSRTGFLSSESLEFDVDLDPLPYNLSDLTIGRTPPFQMIHSVQTSSSLTSGVDLSEFLMSFGTFKIESDFILINDLNIDYVDTLGVSVKVPVDYSGENYDDIIALTTTNLYYLDDGFTYLGCGDTGSYCIDDIYLNPCNTYVWQLNTTVEIRVKVDDFHDDEETEINLTMYYDDLTHETSSGWLGNYSDGTTVPYTFIANKTTSNGVLRVQVRNPNRPTSIQTIDYDFSVATVGIEWDDGLSCEYDPYTSAEEEELTDTEGTVASAKEESRGFIRVIFGLDSDEGSYDVLIAFFILIIVGAGALYYAKKELDIDNNVLVFIASAIMVIGWILLVAIELIPAWTLVVGIIMAGVLLSLKFLKINNNPSA